MFDFTLAVERISAARKALNDLRSGVLLTARSEGFVRGHPDLAETIRRLVAYSHAGADCLFAPGVRTEEQITAIVKAVAPKPVNVIGSGAFTAAELGRMGVRRISTGGALARTAWSGFLAAANDIAENGSFAAFSKAMAPAELNGRFARD